MSVTITPLRLALLAACLGAYWFLGGFTPPESQLGLERIHPKSQRAWLFCILAFTAGAVSVSVIDHSVGHIDPTNLRFAYILFGIALMALAILWNHSLVAGIGARIGSG